MDNVDCSIDCAQYVATPAQWTTQSDDDSPSNDNLYTKIDKSIEVISQSMYNNSRFGNTFSCRFYIRFYR